MCTQVTEKKAMDILNVVSHPIIRQIEDGTLIGRGEVTFIMEIRIYIVKCTYMYGFLLIILGKAMSYHICQEELVLSALSFTLSALSSFYFD